MQRTYLALAVALLAPPALANSLMGSEWANLKQPPVAPPPLPQIAEPAAPAGIVALEVIPFRP